MEASLESKPRVCYEFEVEKIIAMSSDGSYQVRWAPAWVSKFHLVGCEHLIQEFLQEQPQQQQQQHQQQQQQQQQEQQSGRPDHPELRYEIPTISSGPDQYTGVGMSEINVVGRTPGFNDVTLQCEPLQLEDSKPELETLLVESGIADQQIDPLNSLVNVGNEVACSTGFQMNAAELSIKTEEDLEATVVDHDAVAPFPGCAETPFALDVNIHSDNASSENPSLDATLSQQSIQSPTNENNSTHTGDKQYTCQYCKKTFDKNISMEKHLCSHRTKKRYECSQCNSSFPKKSTLTAHLRTHKTPFKCEECGKLFMHKNSLAEHMSLHTGIKPYRCEVCQRTFSYRSAFKNHVRLHTGEKPVKCSACGKKFTTTASRKNHVKRCSKTQLETSA